VPEHGKTPVFPGSSGSVIIDGPSLNGKKTCSEGRFFPDLSIESTRYPDVSKKPENFDISLSFFGLGGSSGWNDDRSPPPVMFHGVLKNPALSKTRQRPLNRGIFAQCFMPSGTLNGCQNVNRRLISSDENIV
jgi:hypothetical protein